MLELFFLLIVYTVCTFLMINNPFFMALTLAALSLFSASLVGLILDKWLFFATSLVFMGGMMVMFTYIAAMSFGEKIKYHKPIFKTYLNITLLFSTLLLLNIKPLHTPAYSFYTLMIPLLFLITYLLFSLLIAMTATNSQMGSMVSKI